MVQILLSLVISQSIEQLRERALQYNRDLPNFVCIQVTQRQQDSSGTGERWKTIDTIEEQLTYFDRREKYEILSINGKSARNRSHDTLKHFRTSGEFGRTLQRTFDPQSMTEFQVERPDKIGSRPVHVLSYRVPQAHSRMEITRNKVHVVVGYHGLAYVDVETGLVLRLTAVCEMPPGFPIQAAGTEVDHDYVEISGQRFLVPIKSETFTQTGRILDRNVIQFTRYRKFDAATSVTFDDPDKKK
jgi:hypothetical protein